MIITYINVLKNNLIGIFIGTVAKQIFKYKVIYHYLVRGCCKINFH